MRFTSGPNRPELFEEHLDLLSLSKRLIGSGAQKGTPVCSPRDPAQRLSQGTTHSSLQLCLPASSPNSHQPFCPVVSQAVAMETAVVANRTVPSLPCGLQTVAECGQKPWHRPQASVRHSGETLDGNGKPQRRVEHSLLRQPAPARPSSLGQGTAA